MLLPRAGLTTRGTIFIDSFKSQQRLSITRAHNYPEGIEFEDALLSFLENIENYRYKAPWDTRNEREYLHIKISDNEVDPLRRQVMFLVFGLYDTVFEPLPDFVSCSVSFFNTPDWLDAQSVRESSLEMLDLFINAFEPYYGCLAQGILLGMIQISLEEQLLPSNQWSEDMIDTQPYASFRSSPWSVYSRTMYFGRSLLEKVDLERLMAAPIHRKLDLPHNSLLLIGPRGVFDGKRLFPDLPGDSSAEYWRKHDLEQKEIANYDKQISKFLGLSDIGL